MMSVNFDAMSNSSSVVNGPGIRRRGTMGSSMRDNESVRLGSRGNIKGADPMRESSMKFFKEAFENISMHAGGDSMSTLFLKEK